MFKLMTGYFTWNLLRWTYVFLFTLAVVVFLEKHFMRFTERNTASQTRPCVRRMKRFPYEKFPLDTSRILSEYIDYWFKSRYIEIYIFVFFFLLSCAAVFF